MGSKVCVNEEKSKKYIKVKNINDNQAASTVLAVKNVNEQAADYQ